MKTASMLALAVASALWGQTVKPTPGALGPMNATPVVAPAAAPAAKVAAVATPLSIGKAPNVRDRVKALESDFDFGLKAADRDHPIDVFGMTRGIYLRGFGAVFTTEIDLSRSEFMPMFHTVITPEEKAQTHARKLKHLELVEARMRAMAANIAKSLDGLAANEQVVVAVRMMYQSWEDRSGLPEQVVMRAERAGALSGDLKVDTQF